MTPLRLCAIVAALALAFVDTGSNAQGRSMILSPSAPNAILSAQRGFSLANVDPTCKPCQDFYRYAMGGWQTNNPIPPAATRWSVLEQLRDANRSQLRDLLESISREGWPHGTPAQKAGDYYASCMNVRERDAAGFSPIAPYLTAVREIKDLADVRSQTATLQNIGVHAFFVTGIEGDPRDATHSIAMIAQDGLGLPDRDLYLAADARTAAIREGYITHAARYFQLLGDDAPTATSNARAVLSVETALARAARNPAERRDRYSNYHKMTLAEAQALIPGWDLTAYYRERMAARVETIDVQQPDYVRGVEATLRSTPVRDLRAYLRYHLIDRAARSLSTPFSDEAFSFDLVLNGKREQIPLWDRCVRMVDGDLGDALGQLYVARRFSPETRASAKRVVDAVESAMREQLGTLTWMSASTRREALAKLDAIAQRIGSPERWRRYDTLEVDRGLFFNNTMHASLYRSRLTFSQLGRAVDRDFWAMTASTSNASYDAAGNEITIPAGILQPPFFSPRYDDATNFGAIGAIVAHEFTHAFDDEGRKSDGRGELRDWWQPADAVAFSARSSCIEREFTKFTVTADVHENGKLVLGEAIADLGGAQIAYRALERSLAGKPRTTIDGWTPEQRFFLAFAQAHANFDLPERARMAVLIDPHPSGRDRVIGTLENMPEFASAFHCRSRDPMVRPVAQRCGVF